MKIKITENQLKNLFLIKEQNEECYLKSDFLKGCKEIISTGDFKFTFKKSKSNEYGCFINFHKKLNNYEMFLSIFEDGYMLLKLKPDQSEEEIYATNNVQLNNNKITISKFYHKSDQQGKSKIMKIYSWDDLKKWLKSIVEMDNEEKQTLPFADDISKLKDLLSWNVDDDDFKKITTIVRKYMNNKEDFCKLRQEYYDKYGDWLYEEITGVSISTQSLVKEFHIELHNMGKCDK